jgi:hypothetical protein
MREHLRPEEETKQSPRPNQHGGSQAPDSSVSSWRRFHISKICQQDVQSRSNAVVFADFVVGLTPRHQPQRAQQRGCKRMLAGIDRRQEGTCCLCYGRDVPHEFFRRNHQFRADFSGVTGCLTISTINDAALVDDQIAPAK